jgi:hypothetical protein
VTITNFSGIVGPIHVGTGGPGSRGHVTPMVKGNDDIADAINDVASFARSCGHKIVCHVAPGEYNQRSPIDLSGAVLELRMSRGTRIIQKDLGSPYMIRMTGQESELDGGTFISEKFVAGQRHIFVEAAPGQVLNRVRVANTQGFFLDTDPDNAASPYDDSDGTTKDATSMVHLDVSVAANSVFENCIVVPQRGVIGYRLTNGLHNTMRNLDLSNEGPFFFPIIDDTGRIPCRIGYDIYGETALTIDGGNMRNLGQIGEIGGGGELLEPEKHVEHAIRHRYPNVASTTYEYGHFKARGVQILDCLSQGLLWYTEGMRWGSYKALYMCFNGIASTAASGFMGFVNAGSNHLVRDIDIDGHFHNWGTGGSSAIYIKGGQNFNLMGVHFSEANSDCAIVIDSQVAGYNLGALKIPSWSAHWRTATPTDRWLINRLGSTSTAGDLFVGSGAASTDSGGTRIDGIYKTGATAFTRHCVNGLYVPSTGAVYSGDIGSNGTALGT